MYLEETKKWSVSVAGYISLNIKKQITIFTLVDAPTTRDYNNIHINLSPSHNTLALAPSGSVVDNIQKLLGGDLDVIGRRLGGVRDGVFELTERVHAALLGGRRGTGPAERLARLRARRHRHRQLHARAAQLVVAQLALQLALADHQLEAAHVARRPPPERGLAQLPPQPAVALDGARARRLVD